MREADNKRVEGAAAKQDVSGKCPEVKVFIWGPPQQQHRAKGRGESTYLSSRRINSCYKYIVVKVMFV